MSQRSCDEAESRFVTIPAGLGEGLAKCGLHTISCTTEEQIVILSLLNG